MNIDILKNRFLNNMHRHSNIKWEEVEKRLTKDKLEIINKMNSSGGEADLIMYQNEYLYVDFSKETPLRRNVCYDDEALNSRKTFKPDSSAKALAKEIGINLLTKEMYLYMQSLENIDLKTSSWLETPDNIRELGGAIFGDNRYNQTFIYHNGAESYYNVRGFRGYIKI